MAATAQLNVRMDRETKERGDAVLLERGASPSLIVRKLWATLAQGGDAFDRVVDLLEGDGHSGPAPVDVDAADDPAVRATRFYDEALATLGISGASLQPDHRSWREMREEAIESRLAERGVL